MITSISLQEGSFRLRVHSLYSQLLRGLPVGSDVPLACGHRSSKITGRGSLGVVAGLTLSGESGRVPLRVAQSIKMLSKKMAGAQKGGWHNRHPRQPMSRCTSRLPEREAACRLGSSIVKNAFPKCLAVLRLGQVLLMISTRQVTMT